MEMQNIGIFVINIAKSDDLWRDVTAAIVHYPNFDTTSPLSKEVPLYLLFLFLCIGRDEERKWKSNVRKICLKQWQHIVVVEMQQDRKARDGPQRGLVIFERLFLDKDNPNILHNEMTAMPVIVVGLGPIAPIGVDAARRIVVAVEQDVSDRRRDQKLHAGDA